MDKKVAVEASTFSDANRFSKKSKIGARKCGSFIAVSTAPSINKTPRGSVMVPVAYSTTADLTNSIGVSKSVFFNSAPVYLLDSSSQPFCKGDEQGTGGGIRSGTVNGEVKPVKGSKSVRVEGKSVVREGDPCTMNGGNNPGTYIVRPSHSTASPKNAHKSSNPPLKLETQKESSAYEKWWNRTIEDVGQAIKHPVDGGIGAFKGLLNSPIHVADLLLKAIAEQRAGEFDEAAMMLTLLGNEKAGKAQSEVARQARHYANEHELPKVVMANSAQEGGDTISAFVQLFAGALGGIRSASRLFGALGKEKTLVSQLARSERAAFKEEPVLPHDGVRVSQAFRRDSAEKLAENEYGVAFFGADNLQYYTAENATIGAPGRSFFMMPLDDSGAVKNAHDAARYTGMAPSAQKAYLQGKEIFGISFPTKNMNPVLPTTEDALGWPHFLGGGTTAVRLNAGPNSGYLMNAVRERVIPGGNAVPSGSILFQLGPKGEWIPLKRF